MAPLQNARWERFAQGVFAGHSATEAYIMAGYSRNAATECASRLLTNANVQARISELQESAAEFVIMSQAERMERLTEIARARLTDFVTCGPDGSWINVGLESAHSAAIAEITSSTEYDDNGSKPTVVTKIKLHDPVKAIAELNKMDGAYSPIRADLSVDAKVAQEVALTVDPRSISLEQAESARKAIEEAKKILGVAGQ